MSLLFPQHQHAAQAAGQRQQMSRITMSRMRRTATGMPMARPSTAASDTEILKTSSFSAPNEFDHYVTKPDLAGSE